MKFISPAVPTYIHCHSTRFEPTICSPTPMTTHHTLCVWHYVNGNMCGAVAANHSTISFNTIPMTTVEEFFMLGDGARRLPRVCRQTEKILF